MNKLSAKEFEEIRAWIYRNARPIELARWRYHFEDGSKEDVLKVLAVYQNRDGGFGLGLEADNWNPHSLPYTTGTAIDLLKEIGFTDATHPIVQGILAYLDSGKDFRGGVWPFTVESNDRYPHAPWWTYSEENNAEMGFNPSSVLAGFLLYFAKRPSALYEKALSIAYAMVDKVKSGKRLEVHEVASYCEFIADIRRAGLSGQFDCAFLEGEIKKKVNESIERDPAKWPVYSMRPSMYINSPRSPFYKGNEDVMEKELTYILNSRMDCGVWDISWKWADYPDQFVISANWWRGYWAIRNLLLLKAFDRIEG